MSVADGLATRQSDHRIVGMEFPVGFFIGLLHTLYAFHEILGGNVFTVDGGGIADQAQHGAVSSHPCIYLHVILIGKFFSSCFWLGLSTIIICEFLPFKAHKKGGAIGLRLLSHVIPDLNRSTHWLFFRPAKPLAVLQAPLRLAFWGIPYETCYEQTQPLFSHAEKAWAVNRRLKLK